MKKIGLRTFGLFLASVGCVMASGYASAGSPTASWLFGGGVLLGLSAIVSLALRPTTY